MGCRRWMLSVAIGVVAGGATLLAGCGGEGSDLPRLKLEATPSDPIGSYRGGTAVWVVAVEATPADAGPIEVSADSADGIACEVVPSQLGGSGVVEVIARPGPAAPRRALGVTVRAQAGEGASARGEAQVALPLRVLNYQDQLGDEARQRFTAFTSYLAAQHPEFGIDDATAWEGWVPTPNILVVMWYSFLSADYEALIRWHVMIPPYDWTEVFLRQRGSVDCVWAGKIPTAGAPVEEVAPPDVFPRFEAPLIPLSQP